MLWENNHRDCDIFRLDGTILLGAGGDGKWGWESRLGQRPRIYLLM